MTSPKVAVMGGGAAGLFAAETLAGAGRRVVVFDAMPSAGRKVLMAGRSGLNLTHAEPPAAFAGRYGEAQAFFAPLLAEFGPGSVRAWADGLGAETFVGTSGRVFPKAMKATGLLRAWLGRLGGLGVEFRLNRRWAGLDETGASLLDGPDGRERWADGPTLLALGGASWPRLGTRGDWVAPLRELGVEIAPFRPANCAIHVAWDQALLRHEGAPLKNVALSHAGQRVTGELVLTGAGLEGTPAYSLASKVGAAFERGPATLYLDLKPDLDPDALARRLERPRGRTSFSNWLRKAANLGPLAAALLRFAGGTECDGRRLAALVKAVPLPVAGLAPMERAISCAGGIKLAELDETMMIRRLPGIHAAGEMLDWDAPTGGYLLTGCLATGRKAALGILSRA